MKDSKDLVRRLLWNALTEPPYTRKHSAGRNAGIWLFRCRLAKVNCESEVKCNAAHHYQKLPIPENFQVGLEFFHESACLDNADLSSVITGDLVRRHERKCAYHAATHHDDEDDVDSRRYASRFGLLQSDAV